MKKKLSSVNEAKDLACSLRRNGFDAWNRGKTVFLNTCIMLDFLTQFHGWEEL